MKKLTLGLMTALFLLIGSLPLKADAGTPVLVTTTPAHSPEAQSLINRLEEIKSMDKKAMSASEKKELRKEVRSIKSNLKTLNDGVYLSVGAIIIIVLLLILLL